MANPNVGGQQSDVNQSKAQDPDSDDEDDEEVVETSPCGRWEKHKKEVTIIFTLFKSFRPISILHDK